MDKQLTDRLNSLCAKLSAFMAKEQPPIELGMIALIGTAVANAKVSGFTKEGLHKLVDEAWKPQQVEKVGEWEKR